ncbi:MAG: hypothetical protein AAFV33_10395 [Chloroflexota bacterium]
MTLTIRDNGEGASYVISVGVLHVYGYLIEREDGKTGVSGYAEFNAILLLPGLIVFGGLSLLTMAVDFGSGLLIVGLIFAVCMAIVSQFYYVAQKILEEVAYAIVE